jgi:dolichyl-diphosphooligosaccharide--protein glycosyltransferase
MRWLRTKTPEPFASDDAYYRTDVTNSPSGEHRTRGYGVLAWWDYGYWITRIAHRVPNTNPRQTQVADVAAFLLAQTAQEAAAVLTPLHTRYVVVDGLLQVRVPDVAARRERSAFFESITLSAGRTIDDFCQVFELSHPDGATDSAIYCFPQYYRSMAMRLYAFGGHEFVPPSVTAISWIEQRRGKRNIKRLVDKQTFHSFEEAQRFVASRPSPRWRIASADPLTSCVPLEELKGYTRVFQSLGHQPAIGNRAGPAVVQIYEYRGPQ